MGGLVITLLKGATGAKVVVDRRLFLNADQTKVVEEGDPEAAFLFAAAGREVLKADLKKLGCQFTTKADTKKAEKAEAAAAKKAEAEEAAAKKAEADEAAAKKAEADEAAAKKAEAAK
jgi:colicin import membrane protein